MQTNTIEIGDGEVTAVVRNHSAWKEIVLGEIMGQVEYRDGLLPAAGAARCRNALFGTDGPVGIVNFPEESLNILRQHRPDSK